MIQLIPILCVSESRYATAVVIISRTFRFSKGVDIVLLVAFETYRGRHHISFAIKLNSLEIGFRISDVSASAGEDFNFIPNDTAKMQIFQRKRNSNFEPTIDR